MTRHARQSANAARGAILLEVVLATTLFVFGAAVIGTGLSRCLDSAYRLRIRARAADLAVTRVSEIQIGVIPAVATEPTWYEEEDLQDWTWAVEIEPVDSIETMNLLRVTVRHDPSGVRRSLSRWVEVPAEEVGP